MNNATDLIAKLLANEDLTVVQATVDTASFDIKDRVLTLPIWKDASEDVIGMLVGHEVGHALYTGMEYLENEFTGTEYERAFHGYLNVLEDVRIEKLMKRKYPGIRKTFNAGYKELIEKDFFGTKSMDMDDLLLIDKINLYYKAGYGTVILTKEEKALADKAEKTESIQDVLALAKEIFDYTKEQLEQKMQEAEQQMQASGSEAQDQEDDEDGEEGESQTYSNGHVGSDNLEDMLEAKTETSYQKKVSEMADTKTQYIYSKPGKFKYDPLVSHKKVAEVYDKKIQAYIKAYGEEYSVTEQKLEKIRKLKTESAPVVSYLIKEFEMKKAATAYKRTVIAKTGQLDMRKIYAYTMKDDLFKRVSTVKTGKNHGMIFLLDWSGSMNGCMAQTIDQVINLAMFCRSAQIPFQVLAFSDRYRTESQENLTRADMNNDDDRLEVNADTMSLLEFFNHTMTASEFNAMITRLKTYMNRVFSLNGTPLNQSLNYMIDHVGKFKKQYNVEKLTFITLTDGQGETLRANNYYAAVYNGRDKTGMTYKQFLLDEKTGKSYPLNRQSSETYTKAFLEMIKERYDATVLGFYLTCTGFSDLLHVVFNHYEVATHFTATIERMKKEIKHNGYASLKGTGRDELFVIPLQAKIEDGSIDSINTDGSTTSIAKQFGKLLNKRKTSRVLLSKFIDYIA